MEIEQDDTVRICSVHGKWEMSTQINLENTE
jgi:hypothetical protein